MTPVMTDPPQSPAVDLAKVKAQLFINFDEHDYLIASYADAATGHLDGYTGILGRCLINQKWSVGVSAWPAFTLNLPFPDVQSAVVKYIDPDGDEQTLDASKYSIVRQSTGCALVFRRAFDRPQVMDDLPEPITVEMLCGYGSSNQDVPEPIQLAIMQLVAHWYENRAAVSELNLDEIPLGVDRLIAPYRRVFF